MFGNNLGILYSSLERTGGFVRANSIMGEFARANTSSLERTSPSREGSSKLGEWLKWASLLKGFARANLSSLKRTSFWEGLARADRKLTRTNYVL